MALDALKGWTAHRNMSSPRLSGGRWMHSTFRPHLLVKDLIAQFGAKSAADILVAVT